MLLREEDVKNVNWWPLGLFGAFLLGLIVLIDISSSKVNSRPVAITYIYDQRTESCYAHVEYTVSDSSIVPVTCTTDIKKLAKKVLTSNQESANIF